MPEWWRHLRPYTKRRVAKKERRAANRIIQDTGENQAHARRIKGRKSSACGLCKPWRQGWADKKTARDIQHAQRAAQQLREGGF
jgi:hypothetical protein